MSGQNRHAYTCMDALTDGQTDKQTDTHTSAHTHTQNHYFYSVDRI